MPMWGRVLVILADDIIWHDEEFQIWKYTDDSKHPHQAWSATGTPRHGWQVERVQAPGIIMKYYYNALK